MLEGGAGDQDGHRDSGEGVGEIVERMQNSLRRGDHRQRHEKPTARG